MAKKPENAEANANGNGKPRIGEKDDEGYVSVGQWDIDGWYKPEAGRTIQGTVKAIKVAWDDDNNRAQLTYVVELVKPLLAKPVGEDTLEEFPPGAIIGLSESFALKVIRQSVDLQADVGIKATPTEKIKLGGRRSMWKWDVGLKPGAPRKAPLGIDAQLAACGAQGSQNDDAPPAHTPF